MVVVAPSVASTDETKVSPLQFPRKRRPPDTRLPGGEIMTSRHLPPARHRGTLTLPSLEMGIRRKTFANMPQAVMTPGRGP
jgi:hypothetical protein